jgi:hypothetical protein
MIENAISYVLNRKSLAMKNETIDLTEALLSEHDYEK